jgi:cytochrome c oxidase assembly factor CtaG
MLNWIGNISAIAAFVLFLLVFWHMLGRLARHMRLSRPMALATILCLGWLLF